MINNLPTLSAMLESFYKDKFICHKTKLEISFKLGEYVISRNNCTLVRIKEDETFESELGINKGEVYKIIYDLFISNKEVIRNEFEDFFPKSPNPWDTEAYEKEQKQKAHDQKVEWLNEQIEKGLRLLGLAVLEKDKEQIKLVKHDLKLLMKDFKNIQ